MREDSSSAVVLPSVSARSVLGEILREGAQRTLAEAVQAEVPSGSTRGGMSSMNAGGSKSSASATEAAGHLSGVGRTVIDLLLRRGLPVRALVRQRDERADALRDAGAEVVGADLTRTDEVFHALEGERRVYFGMSLSPTYLEVPAAIAATAKERGVLKVLVNMSPMTVSQMRNTELTDSQQQRQHWLAEQVLNWSGLPVVHVRPTIILQSVLLLVGASISHDNAIRLPFGTGKTSPVDAGDVVEVIVNATFARVPAAVIGMSSCAAVGFVGRRHLIGLWPAPRVTRFRAIFTDLLIVHQPSQP